MTIEVLEQTGSERKRLVDRGVSLYFENLGRDEFPAADQLGVAHIKVLRFLKEKLLDRDYLSKTVDRSLFNGKRIDELKLHFDREVPKLAIPVPTESLELRPVGLAFAALLGAFIGHFFLGPLSLIVYGTRELGLALGGPVGAFGLVWGVLTLSRRPKVRRGVQFGLGVATFLEAVKLIWPGLRPDPALRGVWKSVKHVCLCVATIVVLSISDRRTKYDRKAHEDIVRLAIDQWVQHATVILAGILGRAPKGESGADDDILRRLGSRIYAVHEVRAADLAVSVEELIQEAKNMGFEGLDGVPAFRENGPRSQTKFAWSNPLKEQYETYGHIEEGDMVKVERKPVIFRGKTVERGVVRKIRGEN